MKHARDDKVRYGAGFQRDRSRAVVGAPSGVEGIGDAPLRRMHHDVFS